VAEHGQSREQRSSGKECSVNCPECG
jgi:hypothetical protein